MPVVNPSFPHVGLALSGGGFRAAAFHLGVLKRLEELGVLRQVEALSTVSGGSIIGALYALRCVERGDGFPGSYPVDELIRELRPFLLTNLRGRALFGTPIRAIRTLLSIVSRRISRIGLIVEDLDRELFGAATVDRLPPWIVINATNLRTGKAWKFFADRAGDFLAGATDDTSRILVAEAVGASAAYPVLTDSYAFRTRWEDLRGDLLTEERWERPAQSRPGLVSRWRERFGEVSGSVAFPLVDGGIYDNEGINSLRGQQVTHAIISGAMPPESDDASGFSPFRYKRLVEVMHSRLGAATRQLAHEMTHGIHPTTARNASRAIAQDLRALAADVRLSDEIKIRLKETADRADALSAVGLPPRGLQFVASAQILLHRTDVADTEFNTASQGGLDVPAEYRGLDSALIAELARVRTDLDALDPTVMELLMAQGYFLADFYLKLFMPELCPATVSAGAWYDGPLAPTWKRAHKAVTDAMTNRAYTTARVRTAGSRGGLIGYGPDKRHNWTYRLQFALVALPLVAVLWMLTRLIDAGVHGFSRLVR